MKFDDHQADVPFISREEGLFYRWELSIAGGALKVRRFICECLLIGAEMTRELCLDALSNVRPTESTALKGLNKDIAYLASAGFTSDA